MKTIEESIEIEASLTFNSKGAGSHYRRAEG